jgi:tetratricopeptide (TPR) repeat protein
MSARLPSRWLFAAALLAAEGLTSAAMAQPPGVPAEPPVNPAPQAAPASEPVRLLPGRIYVEPLLIEEEQVSEHAEHPQMAAPVRLSRPRVTRGCGLMPECDRDEGKMSAGEVTLRCLLFTIHPLAAFLPMVVEVEEETLPAPNYLQQPPQYIPPSPAFPLLREEATLQAIEAKPTPEQLGMPEECERLDVMPVQVEPLDTMPVEEESESQYQLLGPWIDSASFFHLPAWPLAELQVSVQEAETGSPLFGLDAEVSRTGNIIVNTEPLSAPKEEKAACACPATPPQVMLNVLIAEVKATAARKLNLDRTGDGQAPRWVIEVADESREQSLEAGLKGLREKGRAKVLAEPRLVTLSGRPASFLSGGQVAVPMPTGLGQVGVQFEEFGARVNFLPVVLADRTIRLEVEPEISDLCETANVTVQGTIVPGRSSQRVHTTADVAPRHTLVITGPKAGGDTRLVLLVTPSVVEPPAASPSPIPQLFFRLGNAVRDCVKFLDQFTAQPSTAQEKEAVHDLLVKCRRELSRGHYAAAEDLVQRALEYDREQVLADPLVQGTDLVQQVKEVERLPWGAVDPCEAKTAGADLVSPGEAKAIGSSARMAEALMQEFNAAYQQGNYPEAAALARRAAELSPDNAAAAAAVRMARTQLRGPMQQTATTPNQPAPVPAKVRSGKSAKEREIERCLDKPVSLSFDNVPLSKVIDDLSTMQGINIVPDMPALNEEGVDLGSKVSFRVEDMTLKSALKNLLNNVHLTYVVEDEALKITTPTKARGKPVPLPYCVGELGGPENLPALIRITVAPKTWDGQGGAGTVEFFPKTGLMVVNQLPDVQEEIADLLAALRRFSGDEADKERQRTDAIAQFHGDFKAARYEEAKLDALKALAACPGNPVALAALRQACEALARQPQPESVPQCTFVSGLRPALRRTDPAVVNALQKLLTDSEKANPLGGTEEAEPKDNTQPAQPRR